jgi:hypothetical protein
MGSRACCEIHRNERVFDSLPEHVFVVNPLGEQLFSEQVFDPDGEHLYALPHVRDPHRTPAPDPPRD